MTAPQGASFLRLSVWSILERLNCLGPIVEEESSAESSV